MAIYDPLLSASQAPEDRHRGHRPRGVGALAFFLLIQPKWDERDALWNRNESPARQGDPGAGRRSQPRGPSASQAAALRKRLEAAQERLPLEREVPRLYRQVSDLAIQSGLGAGALPAARAGGEGRPDRAADRDHLRVGLPPARRLLRQGRHASPASSTWGTSGCPASSGRPARVRAELTLMTYVFRPEGAPPPAAKPGQPGARRGPGRRRAAMRRARARSSAAVTSLVMAGCGSGSPPPPPAPVAAVTPRPPVAPKEPDPGPALAPIPYEAEGASRSLLGAGPRVGRQGAHHRLGQARRRDPGPYLAPGPRRDGGRHRVHPEGWRHARRRSRHRDRRGLRELRGDAQARRDGRLGDAQTREPTRGVGR